MTKHLMTDPSGNSEFYFPQTLNVPPGEASGNIEGLGETNLTLSLGGQSLIIIAYNSYKMTPKRHVIAFIFLLIFFFQILFNLKSYYPT